MTLRCMELQQVSKGNPYFKVKLIKSSYENERGNE